MAVATLVAQRPTARPAYHRATDLVDAIDALAAVPGARPLAGGTDLMNQMRLGIRQPSLVVDLADIGELRTLPHITDPFIGAGVTMRTLLGDPGSRFAALRDAAGLLGGGQMQAVATIAGNLCTASPAAETSTPLLVADTTVVCQGPEGVRRLPLRDLWTGPGTTCLGQGELITGLELASIAETAGSAYRRIELRRSVDIALVGMSALVVVVDGRIADARMAVSAASPTPMLLHAAADRLIDTEVEPGTVTQPLDAAIVAAADAAMSTVSPISDVRASAGYRRAMVGVLVRQTVLAALTPLTVSTA